MATDKPGATDGVRLDKKVPLFRDLEAGLDLDEMEISEVESLCMNCYRNGMTKLLLTKIPMFREVVISSFSCPHCGEKNSDIQSGARIQDKGIIFTLAVIEPSSLNRMLVKVTSAVFRIPELEFEIPASSQKGQVTTVEGILARTIANLEQDQPLRKEKAPEVAEQMENFIGRLKGCLEVKSPFTVILDDPTGNSFLQGDFNESDGCLKVEHYLRTKQQEQELGFFVTEDDKDDEIGKVGSLEEQGLTDYTQSLFEIKVEERLSSTSNPITSDEVVIFRCNCQSCQSPVETRMKLVDIPHFKQVVIMATNCDYCGCRTNEVKPGAGICNMGTKISLRLTDPSDLTRDILKADTASLSVPELKFEVQCGTLGGCFTTVEGLLVQARDQLKDAHCFYSGDSTDSDQMIKMEKFMEELNKVIDGERFDVHVVLDDPAGNSYMQNLNAPGPDPELTIETYKRSYEQDEELGLNDMKTENYTADKI